MANREKGEVTVDLDGTSYTLCMDMERMCLLEDHFSGPSAEVTFAEILTKIERGSMRHLRVYLWASFLKHYPEMTQGEVNDLIQRNGGVFLFSRQLVNQLAAATVPDTEDVKAIGIKEPANPRKAQAKRAGTGANSASRRAALV